MNLPRLRIQPGEHITKSRISINGIDILPFITSATLTYKPGEAPNVNIQVVDGANIPDDLIIELYVDRKLNGHRR